MKVHEWRLCSVTVGSRGLAPFKKVLSVVRGFNDMGETIVRFDLRCHCT